MNQNELEPVEPVRLVTIQDEIARYRKVPAMILGMILCGIILMTGEGKTGIVDDGGNVSRHFMTVPHQNMESQKTEKNHVRTMLV